jgi:D-alanyl-lipoteichoic acid acyltransferase DltB (MBOAT superfamily)
MEEPSRKKLMLFVTVFVNLAFLGFFKYFNFFIDSAESALRAMGYDEKMFHLSVVLPVGISFYTFQSLSYTIDVSRGLVKPAQKFWDFALFVAFFPPMVAGPIERGAHLFPQLLKRRELLPAQLQAGVWLIVWGLFKKMVIADNLSIITSQIFGLDTYTQYRGIDLILGVLCFTFVIYCDFSGYTDIARGVGKLMGFELLINFRLPYFAVNPSDFWRRWHISLSSWLRDYLYIPLGGNRLGPARTQFNLFLTMLLGGLWHGASWNFVLWGAFHGVILIIYRIFERHPDDRDPWSNPSRYPIVLGKMAIMFGLTMFGWMLFASRSLAQIGYLCTNVFGGSSTDAATIETARIVSDLIFFVSPLLVMQLAQYVSRDLLVAMRMPLIGRAGLIAALVVWTAIFGNRAATEFIYFQF